MLLDAMWDATYSQSYHIVSESRPVFPLGEMICDGGVQKPQGGALRDTVVLWQCAQSNHVGWAGDDPALDMPNTGNYWVMKNEV